ncbi:LDLR chaperone boca [Schistocerca gregaria]|uniref:LDLR chaperone boca n=1 Tax=Schistocerca gregaria TaxID=7010 RepID=UPI00211EA240|nr:LDLR chaperone boca [Schistocerca gregaria]
MLTGRIVLCLAVLCFWETSAKKFDSKDKPKWAQKDIRDYNDADLERLFEQWEEDEEPLPEDELPEYLRPPPPIDFSKIDTSDPENLLKVSKKGKTLMSFVSVDGNPTREETEELTKLWQTGLWNSHIQAERYIVDDDRAIFMFKDGSQAWDAKEFLTDQERCKSVVIESKTYYGKHSAEGKAEADKESKKKSSDEL